MINWVNFKKIGLHSTILASSASLVACGGGGSGGYFEKDENSNQDTTGSTEGNTSVDNSALTAESIKVLDLKDLQGNVLTTVTDSTAVQFSVQVLNKDSGGIGNQDVTLSIADSEKLGVTSKASKVTTVEGGQAVFELNIPAITAASGKVQLTATINGTSIKQIYTLNIVKKSVIQSEYSLNIQQGVVLNLPKGTATIQAQVTDKNGGVKAGQNVILTLPEQMQGKFSISSGSSLTTDESGHANFVIAANQDLSSTEIANLIATSHSLQFKLIDEYQSERSVQGAITFKDISNVVQKLELIKADAPVVAQAGSTTVKVRAKNSEDVALANKKVRLSFTDKSDAYGVTIAQTEVVTDAQGYATFQLSSKSSYPIALSQQGINLKAIYVDDPLIFAQDTLSVVTSDNNAEDRLALQRLEIASSYKMNAKDDQVTITVKGINNQGLAATKGKVSLSLNAEATNNAVTFEGSNSQEFKDGYVSFVLHSNASTQASIDALIQSGITATFTADNAVKNEIKISVENAAKSDESVGYLSIDPINTAFDYTVDQNFEIKVKAIGVKGSPISGDSITLAMPKLSVQELQTLGLSLANAATQTSAADGYATFKLSYKASTSAEQKALLAKGLRFSASSNQGAEQNVTVNFKAPTDASVIDLDYLTVTMPGNLVLSAGVEQTLDVTVNATGTDGKVLAGQVVGLGLNDAALSNGVSLVTASGLKTDAQGRAKFQLKVKAENTSELSNLIANGISVAVKGNRQDGSAYTLTRKIDLSQPTVVLPNLANLVLNYDVQTVSVLGGDVHVKVTAKDENGAIIANTPLAIALAGLNSARVSLSDSSLITNSQGEAEFTVKVAEGAYDASLIKNGITFAVVGSNLNNTDRIQQTGMIQVAIPADSVNLRLTADQSKLQFGQSTEVAIAVKDELGANTAYPVNLTLNKEALDAGVKLGSDSVLTSANGSSKVSLIIPKDLSATAKANLERAGIQIIGQITNPKGAVIKTQLNFSVFEPVNLNQLNFNVQQASLSVNGDRTVVVVNLTDANGAALSNQNVSLAANNAATLIVATPGSGQATNTSTPQTVMTDSQGNAYFAVEIAEDTAEKDLLLASGIELTATHTDALGAVKTQITHIATYAPTSSLLPARYQLRVAPTKTTLNVRDDVTDVVVSLVDANGGGVADKYLELALQDHQLNGVIIQGASGLTTDKNGQAIFKIRLDETARQGMSAAEFIAKDLRLTASFSETGYQSIQQSSLIDIVAATVENPIASIVIGVNPTDIASSTDGVYYTRNLSVSVVDFDGKPLANQAVTMDITPTVYRKGAYRWALAPVEGELIPKPQWVAAGDRFYDLTNPRIYLNLDGIPKDTQGTIDTADDVAASTSVNPIRGCVADANGTAVSSNEVSNVPIKVPTFLGQGSTATYRTDSEGKFDFVIRYPKIYAQWLNVRIGASSQIASLPFRTTYDLGLPSVNLDYSDDGSYGPNLNSPYGVLTATCP